MIFQLQDYYVQRVGKKSTRIVINGTQGEMLKIRLKNDSHSLREILRIPTDALANINVSVNWGEE